MEYQTVLRVSDKELFYTIIDSALAEAFAATGKKVSYSDLKGGYKYKSRRQFGKKNEEIVTHIKQPIEHEKIQITVDRYHNHYNMVYQIKYLDKQLTEITYTETDKYKVKNFLQKHKFKRDMKKKMKQIESYIIQKRK